MASAAAQLSLPRIFRSSPDAHCHSSSRHRSAVLPRFTGLKISSPVERLGGENAFRGTSAVPGGKRGKGEPLRLPSALARADVVVAAAEGGTRAPPRDRKQKLAPPSGRAGGAGRSGGGKIPYELEAVISNLVSLAPRGSISRCMETFKGKLTLPDFALIFKEFAQRGDWIRAMRLFKYMQRQQWCAPNEYIYTIMIGIMGREGMLDRAQELFEEMPEHGVEWNVYSFTALINAYGRNGMYERSLDLLARMKREGVAANSITYNTVLHACAKGAIPWDGLVDIFAKMRQEGVQPDIVTFNTLLAACNARSLVEQSAMVFRSMVASQVPPNALSYASLVDTHRRGGQLGGVRRLFQEMSEEEGVVADVSAYNMLIDAYAWGGEYQAAQEVFNEMQQAGCIPNVATYTALLKALGSNGSYHHVRSVFTSPLSSSFPSLLLSLLHPPRCSTRCSKPAASPMWQPILPFSRLWVQRQLPPRAIRLHADESLREKESQSPSPHRKPNLPPLTGNPISLPSQETQSPSPHRKPNLPPLTGNPISLPSQETQSPSPHRKPDLSTYLTLREARLSQILGRVLSRLPCSFLPHQVFNEMQQAGCIPNVATYTALLKALGSNGSYHHVRSVFTQMKASGRKPDLATYRTLLDVFISGGFFREASRLFWDMEEDGVEVDEGAFTSLLVACGLGGLTTEATEIYRFMRERSQVQPSASLMEALISAYGQAGMYDHALTALHESMEMGLSEQPGPFLALMEAYAAGGMHDDAAFVFALMMQSDGGRAAASAGAGAAAGAAGGAAGGFLSGDSSTAGNTAVSLSSPALSSSSSASSSDPYPADASLRTFNALIEAFTKGGLYNEAIKVSEDMEQANCRPSLATHAAMVAAYSAAGTFEAAYAQTTEIREEGMVPPAASYCHLLALCARRGRWQDMRRLIAEMEGGGTGEEHRVVRGLLVGRYESEEFWPIAADFFGRLKREGVAVNRVFLNALMDALWWAGRRATALKLHAPATSLAVFPEASYRSPTLWSLDVHRMSQGAACVFLHHWLSQVHETAVLEPAELPPLFSIVTRWGDESPNKDEADAAPVNKAMLVSETTIKLDDFVTIHAELEACLLAIPTDALPDDLVAQLQATLKQIHDACFEDLFTADMKQQLQALQQDGGGSGGAGVRRSSSLGTPYTQSQFPAGQLADALGMDSGGAFRKEQEALALEKRKAAESRDKAQEALMDQLITILMRMERELPAFKESQAKLARERASAAAAASSGGGQRGSSGLSGTSSVPKSPKELLSPTRRRMMLLANAVDDMTGDAAGLSLTGSGGSGSAGRERRSRRSGAEGGGAGEGGRESQHDRYDSQTQQQQQQQHSRFRDGEGDGGGRTDDDRQKDRNRAVRGEREHRRSTERRDRGKDEPGSGTAMPGSKSTGGAGAGDARSKSPFDMGGRKGGDDLEYMDDPTRARTGSSSGREKDKMGKTGSGGSSASSVCGGSRTRSKTGRTSSVDRPGGNGDMGGMGGELGGEGGGTGAECSDPEADLAAYDPEAPQQIVQNLLFGSAEEKGRAAGLVGWYASISAANRSTFREAGAVDALLPLAVGGPRDPKGAESALAALLNLSSDEMGKQELLTHLPLLIQALKRADFSPAAGSSAANVMKCAASFSDRARGLVIDAGAVPPLVKQLTGSNNEGMHPGYDTPSRQAAAEAVACLAQCESQRSKLVGEGVIPALAVALQANLNNETVVATCQALSRLATVPDGREAMGEAIPSLVTVLRLDYPAAVRDAVEALLQLAKHSPTHRSNIRNSGGMRYLRNVLRSGPPTLHPKAMELLAALFS
ncbi:unnamed protein product [Closterium sp. Naga37s-1]|nr:unnamed protein product [Closterium sp. Naga37s-1]